MIKSIFLILLGLMVATGLKAQGDNQDYSGDGGAYGYTSVDYDASTNTLTYYAETEIGSDSGYYQGVFLSTVIRDTTTGQVLAQLPPATATTIRTAQPTLESKNLRIL